MSEYFLSCMIHLVHLMKFQKIRTIWPLKSKRPHEHRFSPIFRRACSLERSYNHTLYDIGDNLTERTRQNGAHPFLCGRFRWTSIKVLFCWQWDCLFYQYNYLTTITRGNNSHGTSTWSTTSCWWWYGILFGSCVLNETSCDNSLCLIDTKFVSIPNMFCDLTCWWWW